MINVKFDQFTGAGDRPVRLSSETRQLAHRAIGGEFGRAMREDVFSYVFTGPEFWTLSQREQYTRSIEAVAANTPIRIVEGEWLVGSATYELTRYHAIPTTHSDDPWRNIFWSQSHLTPGYEKAIRIGYKGLRREIEESLIAHAGKADETEFLNCMMRCLDAAAVWHARYMEALDARIASSVGGVKRRYETIRENLRNVPENPPETFAEAIQSVWFIFSFMRACGNWPAVGRIDNYLYPYYKRDLEAGRITPEEAREYLAHFWIKGCEWVTGETNPGNRGGSGDGQNYQNVVLAGLTPDGESAENPLTFMILENVEELGIGDFPIGVRIGSKSSEALVRKVAEVMRYGGGAVAVYNDDIVVGALEDFGYSPEEARSYANDGCWEIQVPGKTAFAYITWDVLPLLQRNVLHLDSDAPSELTYKNIDEIFDAYMAEVKRDLLDYGFGWGRNLFKSEVYTPSMLIALFVDDCIARGRDYWHDGPHYQVLSPHASGLQDAANALQAINYVVFEKKMMSLNEFMDIVKSNWEGNEELRLFLRNHIVYYGNDDPEGDAMMKRVYDEYIRIIEETPECDGMIVPAGISTFGRQATEEYLVNRTANPDGHKKGEFLSHNINPTPGFDKKGATALIRSYCGLGMRKLPGGTALTVKLLPSVIQGDDGLDTMTDILYGFCELGGHFMQLDVVNNEILLAAQKNPEEYSNLVVRVSGWSARFGSLSKEWQDMLIEFSEKGL